MKRIFSFLAVLSIAFVGLSSLTGCSDDVKKEYQSEQTHESEPEMQSPGEFVVE